MSTVSVDLEDRENRVSVVRTPQHEAVARSVARWLRDPHQQVYRLFGPAGTGKTTLVRELVEGAWLYASYTGKAALVMRQKGCAGAQTIHSLIYRPDDARSTVGADGRRQVGFRRWSESPLGRAPGIAVDECSMVDDQVGKDLLAFGKKVLVCGDPEQLPPVRGCGFFTSGSPDFLLTEVHRQAKTSGILDLATFVRQGGDPADWVLGTERTRDCEVVDRCALTPAEIWHRMITCDQVIVGTNRMRRLFNAKHRRILGRTSPLPEPGDKVVCLRNDREQGLFNGSMWRVETAQASPDQTTVTMALSSDDGGAELAEPVRAWSHHFFGRGDDLPEARRRQHQEFDYGYHVTCHKAQGSQWGSVVLFDESRRFDADTARRWLYTGVTRASERLLVVV